MKNLMMKLIAKAAMRTAYSEKNRSCSWATYQPQMPEKLLKSDK